MAAAEEEEEVDEVEREVDEVEVEVRMEDGVREDGAEEAVTGVVEVTNLGLNHG